MNNIMFFFPRIKKDGLESHEIKQTLKHLIFTRAESEIDEKLRALFFEVLTFEQTFFFEVKEDLDHEQTGKPLNIETLQTPAYEEDIEIIKSSIENYFIQNMLLKVLEHFGKPQRSSEQWRVLSCYFKLVYAYSSLSCDHQKRAVKLCEQLRMSLNPNSHQKQSFKKLAEFHRSKNYNLNAITAEITAFEKKLRYANADGTELERFDSSKTMINHLSDIRLIYKHATNPKPYKDRHYQRKNQKIKQRIHTESDLGDEESGNRTTQFVEIAKPLEDDISTKAETEAIDNNFSPKQGTEFSAELQQTISKTNHLHARRNGLGLPSNPRIASLELTQQSFSFTWRTFIALLEKRTQLLDERNSSQNQSQININNSRLCAYGTLTLVFLTGRSIKEVNSELGSKKQNKTFLKSQNKRSEFRITNKIATTSLRKSTAVKQFQLSKGKEILLPLPLKLHRFLDLNLKPNDKAIQNAMTEIKENTSFSLKTHFNKALQSIIQNQLNQALHANIICGVSVTHYAPLYYTAFDTQAVLKTYQSAVTLLVDKLPEESKIGFKDMFSPVFYAQHSVVGSQMAIREDKCALFFHKLHQNATCYGASLKHLSNEQLTGQFNAYTIWLLYVINLLTGIRPVKHLPGFLNQFNLEYQVYWVSDKAASKKDAGRLIPISHFLKIAIENYLNYLQLFKNSYNTLNPHNPFPFKEIMGSKRPFLHLFHLDKFKPISPYYVEEEMKGFLNHNDNWLRHQLRTLLTNRNVPEYLICEIFGHEDWDIQMFEPDSASSIHDLQCLVPHLDSIANELQLKQVEI